MAENASIESTETPVQPVPIEPNKSHASATKDQTARELEPLEELSNHRYLKWSWACALVASPLTVSFYLVLLSVFRGLFSPPENLNELVLWFSPAFIFVAGTWYALFWYGDLTPPKHLFTRYRAPLVYFSGVSFFWLLAMVSEMLATQPTGGHHLENWVFFYFVNLPNLIPNTLISMADIYEGLILAPLLELVGAVLAILIVGIIKNRQSETKLESKVNAGFVALSCISVFFLVAIPLVTAFHYLDSPTPMRLPDDFEVERVDLDDDLYSYAPFSGSDALWSCDNPSLQIIKDFPVLDGATAAFPVYAAVAESVYIGLKDSYLPEHSYDPRYNPYIMCNTTPVAYKRLVAGECDVIFCAEPSKSQRQAFIDAGLQMEATPISRDAFVFFVNDNNPLDNLSTAQVQDIYAGKISNWAELGGADEEIIAFQRPADSGSQTIMLAKVMKDIPMEAAPEERYIYTMQSNVFVVAEYRNYASAIGYSFRFYLSGIRKNDAVKMLSVDGVAPTEENIGNGTYPFVIDAYAITTDKAKAKNPHVQELIDWIVGEEGQELILNNGCVPIAKN